MNRNDLERLTKEELIAIDRLDDIVIGQVAKKVLEPVQLSEILSAYARAGADRETGLRDRLAKVRHGHKEAEAGIARLLELVEQGLMDVEDPGLRERLIGLKVRRDTLAKEAADLQRQFAAGEPQITPDKIECLTPARQAAPRAAGASANLSPR